MPPKRKPDPVVPAPEVSVLEDRALDAAPQEDKKRRRVEEEEEDQGHAATTTPEPEPENGEQQHDRRESKGKERADEHEEEEAEAEALDWKVRQLVDAAIGTRDHIKSALAELFDEDKLDSIELEDVQAALSSLQWINEEDEHKTLTQTNKLCILRHVVEYLEHVPWKELPGCHEIVRKVITEYWQIRTATLCLRTYLQINELKREFGDEALAERYYARLFKYRIGALPKHSSEYRTILQYLADTNDKPKFSLQVKEVFTLQERPAFATEIHGAEGFEQKFKDTKRMLLWHGIRKHHALLTLTDDLPRDYSFVFTSQFSMAVCQERGLTTAITEPLAPEENACLLLAEVAVGEVEPVRSPLVMMGLKEAGRIPRPSPHDAPVVRNDDARHWESNSDIFGPQGKHLADGVAVPTGPVMHMPLGMIPCAPFNAPRYSAASRDRFRLRYLVVVDYLESTEMGTSLPAASPPTSLGSTLSLPGSSYPFGPAPTSSLSPPVSSYSMSSPSPPLRPMSAGMMLPSVPRPLTTMLPTISLGFSSSLTPPFYASTPLSHAASSSSPFGGTYSPSMPPMMMSSSFSPPPPMPTPMPPMMPPILSTPSFSSSSTSYFPSSASVGFSGGGTYTTDDAEWQFYKPEEGLFQSFDDSANAAIERQYQLRMLGLLSAPVTVMANNGVIYGIDFDQMLQFRRDAPDRVREIRRVSGFPARPT